MNFAVHKASTLIILQHTSVLPEHTSSKYLSKSNDTMLEKKSYPVFSTSPFPFFFSNANMTFLSLQWYWHLPDSMMVQQSSRPAFLGLVLFFFLSPPSCRVTQPAELNGLYHQKGKTLLIPYLFLFFSKHYSPMISATNRMLL